MSELSLYTLNKQMEEIIGNVNSSNITQLSTDNIEINYDKGIYYVQYTGEDYVLGDVTLRSGNEFIMIVYNSVSGLTNNDTTEKHYYNIDKNNKDKFNSFYYREIILKENIYSGYLSYVFDFSSDPNSIDVTGSFYWTRKINNKDIKNINFENIDAKTVGGKSAAQLQDYNNLTNKPTSLPASSININPVNTFNSDMYLIGSPSDRHDDDVEELYTDSRIYFNKEEGSLYASVYRGNGYYLSNVNAKTLNKKSDTDFCNAFEPSNLDAESLGENIGFFKNDRLYVSGFSFRGGVSNVTDSNGESKLAYVFCRIWSITTDSLEANTHLKIRFDYKIQDTNTWISGKIRDIDTFLSTSGEGVIDGSLTINGEMTVTDYITIKGLKGAGGNLSYYRGATESYILDSINSNNFGVPFVWTGSVDSDGKPVGLHAGQTCMILES